MIISWSAVPRSHALLFGQPVPRLQHQAAGAVFAEGGFLVPFEAGEGDGRVVGAVGVGGGEDVTELVAGQAVEAGIVGIQFRP
jgi:hypothetical protein